MENTFRWIFTVFIAAILIVRVVYYRKAGARREIRTRTQEKRLLGLLRLLSGLPGMIALGLWALQPVLANWNIQSAWSGRVLLDLPDWLRWFGAVLAPLALALLVWVHRTLDTNFSPTLRLKVHHQLIMHGPYRYVRHPMYTALMLVGLAIVLISANWVIAFVSIPGMTLAVALRIPSEQTMLLELFGEEYQRYMQRTGLVLPRLALPHSGSQLRSA
jgi:protein-S-isoprenylcysteine O-methyltransferase Ste14